MGQKGSKNSKSSKSSKAAEELQKQTISFLKEFYFQITSCLNEKDQLNFAITCKQIIEVYQNKIILFLVNNADSPNFPTGSHIDSLVRYMGKNMVVRSRTIYESDWTTADKTQIAPITGLIVSRPSILIQGLDSTKLLSLGVIHLGIDNIQSFAENYHNLQFENGVFSSPFPSLKSLCLQGVCIDESMKHLSLGSPLLEYLCIDRCVVKWNLFGTNLHEFSNLQEIQLRFYSYEDSMYGFLYIPTKLKKLIVHILVSSHMMVYALSCTSLEVV